MTDARLRELRHKAQALVRAIDGRLPWVLRGRLEREEILKTRMLIADADTVLVEVLREERATVQGEAT